MKEPVKFGDGCTVKQVEELVNPARCPCGKSARWWVTIDLPDDNYASEYYCDKCLPDAARRAVLNPPVVYVVRETGHDDQGFVICDVFKDERLLASDTPRHIALLVMAARVLPRDVVRHEPGGSQSGLTFLQSQVKDYEFDLGH